MEALDSINMRYGKGTARFAGRGVDDKNWAMKQEMKSQGYTTDWEALPIAKA